MKNFETNYANAIAIIGGSGVYELKNLKIESEIKLLTPFGRPSDSIIVGSLTNAPQCICLFLPRHGSNHQIPPHRINHRANIWALKKLGAVACVSLSAVGSLREEIKPLDVIVPDQLIDNRSQRQRSTFFKKRIIAHVSMAEPFAEELRQIVISSAREIITEGEKKVHEKACYINIDGPSFSSAAESKLFRQWQADVVGMTNAPEAKLAREAEIAYATAAFSTDYDSWSIEREAVDAGSAIANLHANAEFAKKLIVKIIENFPANFSSYTHKALDQAIITPKDAWDEKMCRKLAPILARFTN